MALNRRVAMARGMVTTGDYSLPLELGNPWVEWEFPRMPLRVSRFIERTGSTVGTEIPGANGRTVGDFVVYDDLTYSQRV